ncbi:MAG TPA: hypothetical protein PLE30_00190 [Candidatus Kapabacteria bacterium]|nr:hypothetical protein [Candidatus Kapabacteria bacterium]
MKYTLLIILILSLFSCSNKREFAQYNHYGGFDRNNDFSIIGDFNFTIVNTTKISLNNFSGCYQTPLYLGDDDYIVPTIDAKINLVRLDTIIWSYKVDNNLNLLADIVADSSKNLYFVNLDGNFISVNINGKERFNVNINPLKLQLFTITEPLIINNKIIIGTNNGDLLCYDTNGKLIWSNKFSLPLSKVFSADKGDNIYIGLSNNQFGTSDTLIKIGKLGKEIIRKPTENLRIISPIINRDGKIYFAGGKRTIDGVSSEIVCLDDKLNILWKKEVPVLVNQLSHNGKTLFAGGFASGVNEYKTGIYTYDTNGKELWNNYLDAKISSPMLIGEDFFVLTATNENGAGIFVLSNSKGELIKTHSLSNETPLYLIPTVSDNRDLNFFGSQTLFLLKLTETPLEKIIPY